MQRNNKTQTILFYDGICALCNGAVKIIIALDFRERLYFAPLKGETFNSFPALKEISNSIDSLIVYKNENAFVKSAAVIQIIIYLLTGKFFGKSLNKMPLQITDKLYDWIARNRYKTFGKYDSCPLPAPRKRKLFLP